MTKHFLLLSTNTLVAENFPFIFNPFSCFFTVVFFSGPGKQQLSYRLNEKISNGYTVEFQTTEVGNYVVDVNVAGVKAFGSPFITRVYDSSLIRVSEVPSGVVGQPCQFKGKVLRLFKI